MSQQVLTNYFKVSKERAKPEYKDFHYEPDIMKATFLSKPPHNGILIGVSDTVRLWKSASAKPTELHERQNGVSVQIKARKSTRASLELLPLLKSHLQKAIRRQNTTSAIRTAWIMILLEPQSILRRLPIITIEDVALITSTSVIVWLMMAGTKYKLTEVDEQNIIAYVYALCHTQTTYRRKAVKQYHNETNFTELYKLDEPLRSELLALYYRSRAGGTGGDMTMLLEAIRTYSMHKSVLVEHNSMLALKQDSQYDDYLGMRISNTSEAIQMLIESGYFIKESIDFHCYPWILTSLEKSTGLSSTLVKQLIWVVDSCVNERKQATKNTSTALRVSTEFEKLEKELGKVRQYIIDKAICTLMDYAEC